MARAVGEALDDLPIRVLGLGFRRRMGVLHCSRVCPSRRTARSPVECAAMKNTAECEYKANEIARCAAETPDPVIAAEYRLLAEQWVVFAELI